MKKFAFILALLTCSFAVNAQENTEASNEPNYKAIWAHTSNSFSIGWVDQDFASETSSVSHSKYGAMMRYEHSFIFPSKPIGGVLKFGIDLNIPDITVAKYNTDDKDRTDGWESGAVDSNSPIGNLGMWTINLGVGIGPAVHIAPFSHLSNYARYIKAKIYFHYKPTVSALVISEDGDTDGEYAFCNMFDFGGKISFRRISVGVEGHWGNGKFEPVVKVDDLMTTEKTKYKFASTRVYLSLNF